ncbi:hypothetical protein ACFQL4_05255 [Halosimplex aquaticum]
MPSKRKFTDTITVCVVLTLVVGPVAATGGLSSPSTDKSSVGTASTDVTVTDLRVWSSDPSPYPDLSDERPLHEAFSSRADVERAMADGRLHRDRRVPVNGTLVLELRMPGMADRLANASGTNETMRFFDVVYGADDAFRLESMTSSSLSLHTLPRVFRFNRTSSTTVYSDRDADTYYVVVDPTSLLHGWVNFEGGREIVWDTDDDPWAPSGRYNFALNVTIDGRSSRFIGNASVFDLAVEGESWQTKPVIDLIDDDERTVFELPSGWNRTVQAQSGQRLVAHTSTRVRP